MNLSLLQFDDLFTAPECGFSSGRDYYRRCSSLERLRDVRTPTILLTAADDPFVNAEVLAQADLPDTMLLHIEPSGGHVGYLSRRGIGWQRWLKGALVHYVHELVQ